MFQVVVLAPVEVEVEVEVEKIEIMLIKINHIIALFQKRKQYLTF